MLITPGMRLGGDMSIDAAAVAAFCGRHAICKLSLFGSVLRDDFGPASDVDLLVEFVSGTRVTLLTLAGMEIELTEIVGRNVDRRTLGEISSYIRQRALDSSEVIVYVDDETRALHMPMRRGRP